MKVARMPIPTPGEQERFRQRMDGWLRTHRPRVYRRRLKARARQQQAPARRPVAAPRPRSRGPRRVPADRGDPDDDGESDPDPAPSVAPGCPAPWIDWREADPAPPPDEHPAVEQVINLLARAVVRRVQKETQS